MRDIIIYCYTRWLLPRKLHANGNSYRLYRSRYFFFRGATDPRPFLTNRKERVLPHIGKSAYVTQRDDDFPKNDRLGSSSKPMTWYMIFNQIKRHITVLTIPREYVVFKRR